jgi:heterodisulfide reductase subunit A-like polyferredoxin
MAERKEDGREQMEVLVVGAGVAGLQAAISLSEVGTKVHLVERSDRLGGRVAQHHLVYPSLDEAGPHVNGLIAQVKADQDIVVYLNCVVTQVDTSQGFVAEIQSVPLKEGRGCIGTIVVKVGAIILATGLEDVDARIIPELGYGRLKNVITAEDYERMLDPDGPTKGLVLRPSDASPVHSVAFAQCIGSRVEKRGVPYCSAVCCANAIKDALHLKLMDHAVAVFVLYIDIRTHGKGTEALYRKARERGVKFIRGQPAMVTPIPRDQRVLVAGENTLLKELYEIPVDLLVLSVGMRQGEANRELFEMLGVKLDQEGLVENPPAGSDMVRTSKPGIFIAGTAESPKDARESMAQGRAAAMAALQHMEVGWLHSTPLHEP